MLECSMLLDHLTAQRDELLAIIAELVSHESPSRDKAHCDRLADLIAGRFAALGTVRRITNPQGGDHVLIEAAAPDAPADAPPALVLAHYDTVWPIGVLERRPFRVENDRAFGPGVYDMKASIAMVELALRAVQTLNLTLARPLRLLITSDEEIGSPTSRNLIETLARNCAHVLVLEPPTEADRALKLARKGTGAFDIVITGRAAHAGGAPEQGISAITELAHQVLALQALTDHQRGTTVSVGVVQGGSARNVVPASAMMQLDVRAWTKSEADRIEAAIRNTQPVLPGISLTISGGFDRPPMERTPANLALFERARVLGAEIGLDLRAGATGGGSDGNFTAALGVPTLDGLGAPGAGAHADHEQIDIPATLQRTALLTLLLTRL